MDLRRTCRRSHVFNLDGDRKGSAHDKQTQKQTQAQKDLLFTCTFTFHDKSGRTHVSIVVNRSNSVSDRMYCTRCLLFKRWNSNFPFDRRSRFASKAHASQLSSFSVQFFIYLSLGTIFFTTFQLHFLIGRILPLTFNTFRATNPNRTPSFGSLP